MSHDGHGNGHTSHKPKKKKSGPYGPPSERLFKIALVIVVITILHLIIRQLPPAWAVAGWIVQIIVAIWFVLYGLEVDLSKSPAEHLFGGLRMWYQTFWLSWGVIIAGAGALLYIAYRLINWLLHSIGH
jgi:hypothetical protein